MGNIMSVSVISTGSVQVRPEHVERTGSPVAWWLLTSRRWTAPRPINVYVIEHTDGLVLFDTGQDRASVTDSSYFPGGIAGHLYRRLARFAIAADETLTAGLAALGHSVSEVRIAVLSHLHQDHIGGLAELGAAGQAEILVSGAELAQLDRPGAVFAGLLRNHIRVTGLRWTPVTPTIPLDADDTLAPFEARHDVFGDGRLLLLPTPGHTPGSMSMLLRQPGMPAMLFVGDLTYDVNLLAADRVPGVGEPAGLAASSRAVNRLREHNPDLVVLAAHDPAAAELLSAALAGSVS